MEENWRGRRSLRLVANFGYEVSGIRDPVVISAEQEGPLAEAVELPMTIDSTPELVAIAPEVWAVELHRQSGFHLRVRMTVARRDGGLWLHSPIAIDEALAGTLAELGEVRHIVAPNRFQIPSISRIGCAITPDRHHRRSSAIEVSNASSIARLLTSKSMEARSPR